MAENQPEVSTMDHQALSELINFYYTEETGGPAPEGFLDVGSDGDYLHPTARLIRCVAKDLSEFEVTHRLRNFSIALETKRPMHYEMVYSFRLLCVEMRRFIRGAWRRKTRPRN